MASIYIALELLANRTILADTGALGGAQNPSSLQAELWLTAKYGTAMEKAQWAIFTLLEQAFTSRRERAVPKAFPMPAHPKPFA